MPARDKMVGRGSSALKKKRDLFMKDTVTPSKKKARMTKDHGLPEVQEDTEILPPVVSPEAIVHNPEVNNDEEMFDYSRFPGAKKLKEFMSTPKKTSTAPPPSPLKAKTTTTPKPETKETTVRPVTPVAPLMKDEPPVVKAKKPSSPEVTPEPADDDGDDPYGMKSPTKPPTETVTISKESSSNNKHGTVSPDDETSQISNRSAEDGEEVARTVEFLSITPQERARRAKAMMSQLANYDEHPDNIHDELAEKSARHEKEGCVGKAIHAAENAMHAAEDCIHAAETCVEACVEACIKKPINGICEFATEEVEHIKETWHGMLEKECQLRHHLGDEIVEHLKRLQAGFDDAWSNVLEKGDNTKAFLRKILSLKGMRNGLLAVRSRLAKVLLPQKNILPSQVQDLFGKVGGKKRDAFIAKLMQKRRLVMFLTLVPAVFATIPREQKVKVSKAAIEGVVRFACKCYDLPGSKTCDFTPVNAVAEEEWHDVISKIPGALLAL